MPVVVAPGLALLTLIQPEMEVTWNQGGVYYAGRIRAITPRDEWRADYIELDIECQDYTSLLNDEICTSARSVIETDAQRISWLLQSFDRRGISAHNVQTLYSSMPAQDFTGMTLNDAIKAVLAFSNGGFYVDYFQDLHTFVAESLTAPFALSDNPDNVTSFGYNNFQYPQDSVDLRNAVYAIPIPFRSRSADTITETATGNGSFTVTAMMASFKAASNNAITIVGNPGPITRGAVFTSVTPTFNQPTTAGNLLLACVSSDTGEGTTTASGWIKVVSHEDFVPDWVGIWCKPNCLSNETPPTFTNAGFGTAPFDAQLIEFSGAALSPIDQIFDTNGAGPFSTSGTISGTLPSTAAVQGDLLIFASRWTQNVNGTLAFSQTANNGASAVNAGNTGGTLGTIHSSFSYALAPTPIPTWYTDQASITTYGRREASFTAPSSVTTQAALDALGAAYITAHSNPLKHSSLLLPPGSPVGLTAGQTINVTNSLYGLTAQPFRIQSVDTSYPADDKPQFAVQFADPIVTVSTQMVTLQNQIAATTPTASSTTLGTLGYAQVTASQTGISVEVDLTGLSVTVTVGAGRRIRISTSVRVQQQTSAASPIVNLKEASTVLELDVAPLGIGNQATLKPSVVLTPSAGSHTYRLTLQTGAGTVDAVGQAQSPLWIAVEDIGT